MGGNGGDYSDDVNYVRQSSSTQDFSSVSRDTIISKNAPNPSVLPTEFKDIEIYAGQDIVIIVIDGTGSMGDDTFIIRDKIVLLEGQLRTMGYLKNPLIMIIMIGDAIGDKYPIQVTKPERGDPLIEEIEKTYPEQGGWGNHVESYDLAAYYLLYHLILADKKEKPYVFFLGDEGVYETLSTEYIERFIGDKVSDNSVILTNPPTSISLDKLTSKEIFKQLGKKYNVFRLHREYHIEDKDVKIVKQWKDLIGQERVQRLTKPKEVVDDILGIVAIGTKSRTMDEYLNDMRGRGQTQDRIDAVKKVLMGVGNAVVPIKDAPKLPGMNLATKKRTSDSIKL